MIKLLTLSGKLRIIYLFVYACAVCWVPVLSLYYKKAGLNGLEIGILSGIPPAILFIIQPFWGYWADKFGRKKLLIVVMAFSSALYWFFPQQGSFLYLFILTVALGIFWSTVHPLVDCITLDMIADRDEKAFSFFRVWGSIGWSAGSMAMSFIDLSDNLVFNFKIASIFLMICIIAVLSIKSATKTSEANVFDLSSNKLKELFKNLRLITFLIIALFIAIFTAPFWYFTSILYSDLGASSSWISLVFGFQGIVEIPFFFIANYLIKKYGLYQMLVFTFYVNALRSFLYAVVPSPHWAISIELLQGISWSLMWVCCVEYVNDIVPDQWRATGQSLLWSVFFGAGAIIGNIWTGYLYSLMSIQKVFLINSLGLLIFSVIISMIVAQQTIKKKMKAI